MSRYEELTIWEKVDLAIDQGDRVARHIITEEARMAGKKTSEYLRSLVPSTSVSLIAPPTETVDDFLMDKPTDTVFTKWLKMTYRDGYRGEGMNNPDEVLTWVMSQINENVEEVDIDFNPKKLFWKTYRNYYNRWVGARQAERLRQG